MGGIGDAIGAIGGALGLGGGADKPLADTAPVVQRKIKVGGKPLAEDVEKKVETVVVTDRVRMPDSFAITFRDPDFSVLAKSKIDIGPGYQTGFAEAIRKNSRIATAAVGIITDAHQAETILRTGQADFILLARELLRDPYWPRRAAKALGVNVEVFAPQQYRRAW